MTDLPEIKTHLKTICESAVAYNNVKGTAKVLAWSWSILKGTALFAALIGSTYALCTTGRMREFLSACVRILSSLALLSVVGCSTLPAAKPEAQKPSPAPALKEAAKEAETAAKMTEHESNEIKSSVGWLSQVVENLPADLQATTQEKIQSLVVAASWLDQIATNLRQGVVAPVNAGAKQADEQAAQSKELLAKLASETKRADAAELREKESFAASLRGWAIAAAVIGTLALAGAGWLVFSGNIRGATGIGLAGLTLYGGAAALNFLAQYWIPVGIVCVSAVAGLAAYIIWCRIKQEHFKLALQAIIPAVQEAGAAVRPLIAASAADAGTSRIVEKIVTDIKHA